MNLLAVVRSSQQDVYMSLTILGCTVNCRFRFAYCPLIHCVIVTENSTLRKIEQKHFEKQIMCALRNFVISYKDEYFVFLHIKNKLSVFVKDRLAEYHNSCSQS